MLLVSASCRHWRPSAKRTSSLLERWVRMGAAGFNVREDDLESAGTCALLKLHLVGMQASSPPGSVYALDLSGLRAPEVTVWTAWRGERVASVGALKALGRDAAEVKSMRTHPHFLRQGAGAAVLDRIVWAARQRGIGHLSLETGSGPPSSPPWSCIGSGASSAGPHSEATNRPPSTNSCTWIFKRCGEFGRGAPEAVPEIAPEGDLQRNGADSRYAARADGAPDPSLW